MTRSFLFVFVYLFCCLKYFLNIRPVQWWQRTENTENVQRTWNQTWNSTRFQTTILYVQVRAGHRYANKIGRHAVNHELSDGVMTWHQWRFQGIPVGLTDFNTTGFRGTGDVSQNMALNRNHSQNGGVLINNGEWCVYYLTCVWIILLTSYLLSLVGLFTLFSSVRS